ncbi:MAG: ZIP family metal transporter [Candidatus Calescibacterium sp.]|nr:ZIP family metal transporter [Candidatus Calescibacterium sp.]MDW8132335.1 ZIP family metal transporter [Candidatus Calescibacterium sp.]
MIFENNILFLLILYAVLSDLATGLGVLPFLFVKKISSKLFGILAALSGGMMLGASFVIIVDEGFKTSVILTLIGLILGAWFVYYSSEKIGNKDIKFENMSQRDAKIAFLTFIILFVHSFPEGVAIGMAFNGSEPVKLGTIMSLAIAIHNIPEGLMIALTMYPRGVNLFKCFIYAVLSSLPQPIAAIPAFFIGHIIWWTIPLGFGFAGGAMIYLTIAEILPESLEKTDKNTVSFSFITGIVLITFLTKIFS